MTVRTTPVALPDPAGIEQWSELTQNLRDLHLACGRPPYDALSARCGLPKSAISYLIGKNPVRRPSEASVLRFVRGCLSYRGISEAEIAHRVERYRRVLPRLGDEETAPVVASVPIVADPPPPGAISSRSIRSRHRLLPAITILVLLLLGGSAAAAWAAAHTGQPSSASPPTLTRSPAQPSTSTPAVTSPSCTAKTEQQDDVRLDRRWRTVYYCANARTVVFAHPRNDRHPIATLETTKSWFTCWTYGRTAGGAPTSDIWYYTQGDDDLAPAPGWEDWGFVSASALAGRQHPLPGVAQQCDFPG